MKKYLSHITHNNGATAFIAYYADTPNKNYRIYYCGSDTGERFEYLGNASKHLRNIAKLWRANGAGNIIYKYSERDEIPQRGSNARGRATA